MELAAYFTGSPRPFGGFVLHKLFREAGGEWKTSTCWGLATDRQGNVFNDAAEVLKIPKGKDGWHYTSQSDEDAGEPVGWWRPLTEEEWNRTIRHEAQRVPS